MRSPRSSINGSIFLDLDGPILDVSERYYGIYSDILKENNFCPLSKKHYWDAKRNNKPEEMIIYLTTPKEFYRRYVSERMQRMEDRHYLGYDRVFAGIHDVLEFLRNVSELTLVTLRSNRINLLWELKQFGLKDYFTRVLSGNKYTDPSHTKISLIMKKIQINRLASLMIGDTEADIRAGKALGIKTIAVLSGIRRRELLEMEKPDLIVDNLADLPKIGLR